MMSPLFCDVMQRMLVVLGDVLVQPISSIFKGEAGQVLEQHTLYSNTEGRRLHLHRGGGL